MYFTRGDRRDFNSSVRRRETRNNCGNFFEDLIPALELPAVLCVFHGFIANHGEFRLAVPKILKNNHVARTLYGLMFYSIVRRLNLVSLRVGKVQGENDLLVQNNLVVFPTI